MDLNLDFLFKTEDDSLASDGVEKRKKVLEDFRNLKRKIINTDLLIRKHNTLEDGWNRARNEYNKTQEKYNSLKEELLLANSRLELEKSNCATIVKEHETTIKEVNKICERLNIKIDEQQQHINQLNFKNKDLEKENSILKDDNKRLELSLKKKEAVSREKKVVKHHASQTETENSDEHLLIKLKETNEKQEIKLYELQQLINQFKFENKELLTENSVLKEDKKLLESQNYSLKKKEAEKKLIEQPDPIKKLSHLNKYTNTVIQKEPFPIYCSKCFSEVKSPIQQILDVMTTYYVNPGNLSPRHPPRYSKVEPSEITPLDLSEIEETDHKDFSMSTYSKNKYQKDSSPDRVNELVKKVEKIEKFLENIKDKKNENFNSCHKNCCSSKNIKFMVQLPREEQVLRCIKRDKYKLHKRSKVCKTKNIKNIKRALNDNWIVENCFSTKKSNSGFNEKKKADHKRISESPIPSGGSYVRIPTALNEDLSLESLNSQSSSTELLNESKSLNDISNVSTKSDVESETDSINDSSDNLFKQKNSSCKNVNTNDLNEINFKSTNVVNKIGITKNINDKKKRKSNLKKNSGINLNEITESDSNLVEKISEANPSISNTIIKSSNGLSSSETSQAPDSQSIFRNIQNVEQCEINKTTSNKLAALHPPKADSENHTSNNTNNNLKYNESSPETNEAICQSTNEINLKALSHDEQLWKDNNVNIINNKKTNALINVHSCESSEMICTNAMKMKNTCESSCNVNNKIIEENIVRESSVFPDAKTLANHSFKDLKNPHFFHTIKENIRESLASPGDLNNFESHLQKINFNHQNEVVQESINIYSANEPSVLKDLINSKQNTHPNNCVEEEENNQKVRFCEGIRNENIFENEIANQYSTNNSTVLSSFENLIEQHNRIDNVEMNKDIHIKNILKEDVNISCLKSEIKEENNSRESLAFPSDSNEFIDQHPSPNVNDKLEEKNEIDSNTGLKKNDDSFMPLLSQTDLINASSGNNHVHESAEIFENDKNNLLNVHEIKLSHNLPLCTRLTRRSSRILPNQDKPISIKTSVIKRRRTISKISYKESSDEEICTNLPVTKRKKNPRSKDISHSFEENSMDMPVTRHSKKVAMSKIPLPKSSSDEEEEEEEEESEEEEGETTKISENLEQKSIELRSDEILGIPSLKNTRAIDPNVSSKEIYDDEKIELKSIVKRKKINTTRKSPKKLIKHENIESVVPPDQEFLGDFRTVKEEYDEEKSDSVDLRSIPPRTRRVRKPATGRQKIISHLKKMKKNNVQRYSAPAFTTYLEQNTDPPDDTNSSLNLPDTSNDTVELSEKSPTVIKCESNNASNKKRIAHKPKLSNSTEKNKLSPGKKEEIKKTRSLINLQESDKISAIMENYDKICKERAEYSRSIKNKLHSKPIIVNPNKVSYSGSLNSSQEPDNHNCAPPKPRSLLKPLIFNNFDPNLLVSTQKYSFCGVKNKMIKLESTDEPKIKNEKTFSLQEQNDLIFKGQNQKLLKSLDDKSSISLIVDNQKNSVDNIACATPPSESPITLTDDKLKTGSLQTDEKNSFSNTSHETSSQNTPICGNRSNFNATLRGNKLKRQYNSIDGQSPTRKLRSREIMVTGVEKFRNVKKFNRYKFLVQKIDESNSCLSNSAVVSCLNIYLSTPNKVLNPVKRNKLMQEFKKNESVIQQQLNLLMETEEWTSEINFQVAKALLDSQNLRMIAVVLIEFVMNNLPQDEPLDKSNTPPAPLLTRSEQKLVTLIETINKEHSEFFDIVMDGIQYKLFRLGQPQPVEVVESLTRIAVVLGKIRKDREKVRMLICEALYCLNFRAVNVIYIALISWHEIIPDYSESNDILVETIVLTIFSLTTDSPYPKLNALRKLLSTTKNYPHDIYTGHLREKLREKFFQNLKVLSPNVSDAVLIFCKRQGTKWAATNIVKPLSNLVIDSHETHPNPYELLKLLGNILRSFGPDDTDFIESTIIDPLCDILNEKIGSDNFQEGIVSCLLSITKFKFLPVAKSILQWQFNKDLRSTTKIKLDTFFKSHDAAWWSKFIKDNFPPIEK